MQEEEAAESKKLIGRFGGGGQSKITAYFGGGRVVDGQERDIL